MHPLHPTLHTQIVIRPMDSLHPSSFVVLMSCKDLPPNAPMDSLHLSHLSMLCKGLPPCTHCTLHTQIVIRPMDSLHPSSFVVLMSCKGLPPNAPLHPLHPTHSNCYSSHGLATSLLICHVNVVLMSC